MPNQTETESLNYKNTEKKQQNWAARRLFWLPDTLHGVLTACLNTWNIVAFGFARRAGVSDFFSVFFCYCGDHLVF